MWKVFYLTNNNEIETVNKHIRKKKVRLLDEAKEDPFIHLTIEGTEDNLKKLEKDIKKTKPPKYRVVE